MCYRKDDKMVRRLLAVAGIAMMASAAPLFAGVAEAAPTVLVSISVDAPATIEEGTSAQVTLTASRAYSNTNPILQLSIVPGEGCDGALIDPAGAVFRFEAAGAATLSRTFTVSGLSVGSCTFGVTVQNLNGNDEPHAGSGSWTIVVTAASTTTSSTTTTTTVVPTTAETTTTTTAPAIETTSTAVAVEPVLPETGDPSKDHTVIGMLLLTFGSIAVALALRVNPT
ncbi:MAG: hypothetical protein ACO3C1_02590 [Ilumatobacteraceae bacterium]